MNIRKIGINGENFYPATIAEAIKDSAFTDSNGKVMSQKQINASLQSNVTSLQSNVTSLNNDNNALTNSVGSLEQSTEELQDFCFSYIDGPNNYTELDDGVYLINGHKFVDLGLPSGLLWAETNVGAETAYDDGNYYAWGETATKDAYNWSTYKYGSSYDNMTKYNSTDGKTVLENSDDAAYVNWGSSCRMPTRTEFDELCNKENCTWTWTSRTNSSNETINGYEVTSKKNDNSIFLPASGARRGSDLNNHGSGGYYWSGTLNGYGTSYAYVLSFVSGYFNSNNNNRYYGCPVRPVAIKTLYLQSIINFYTKTLSDSKYNTLTEITYSELKELVNNKQLVPGSSYRITDYTTTTTQTNTRATGHDFDVIVKALSTDTLSENASAIQRSNDTYFTGEKLETWNLKYSLENDTTRYSWADSTNGKGVIYYMKDQFNNECNYDFKNIQFIRDADFNATYTFDDYESKSNGTVHYGLTASDYYYYTFTVIDSDNNVLDMSLSSTQTAQSWTCFGNKIGQSNKNDKTIMELNNNVFCGNVVGTTNAKSVNSNTINGYNNTFGGRNVNDNYINCYTNNNFFADAGYCQFNSITGQTQNNIFKNAVSYNVLSGIIYDNVFSGKVQVNIISGSCYDNTITSFCQDNVISGELCDNTFCTSVANYISGLCNDNTISEYFEYSIIAGTFTDNNCKKCAKNNISGYCSTNTVGSLVCNSISGAMMSNNISGTIQCVAISGHFKNNISTSNLAQSNFAHNFNDNTINQAFLNNTVAQDFTNNTINCYFRNCDFGQKIQYVQFNGDATQVNNYRIANGVHGTEDTLLEITPQTGATTERTIVQKEDGTIIDYCLADLAATLTT